MDCLHITDVRKQSADIVFVPVQERLLDDWSDLGTTQGIIFQARPNEGTVAPEKVPELYISPLKHCDEVATRVGFRHRGFNLFVPFEVTLFNNS